MSELMRLAFGDVNAELEKTRRVLERTPGGRLAYRFDRHVARLRELVRRLDEASLAATWTLLMGERVFFAMLRATVLRTGFRRMAHHCGQMSVYFRPLGCWCRTPTARPRTGARRSTRSSSRSTWGVF